MIPVTSSGASRSLVIALSTAVTVTLATSACGPAEPEIPGPVDIETYVVVMAELADLERFPPPGSDEATRAERADSARRDILARHDVTADELLDFAEAAGARPDLMVEIMDRIVQVSDSLAHGRTGAGLAADRAAAADDAADGAPAADTVVEPPDDTAVPAMPPLRDSLMHRERLRELRESIGRERAGDEPRPSP